MMFYAGVVAGFTWGTLFGAVLAILLVLALMATFTKELPLPNPSEMPPQQL